MRLRLSVWPPLPPAVYARRPLVGLPFPLEESRCRVVAWARHAVWHGVTGLGLRPGDEVLMPAWHHGSEVEALARLGIGCRFYDGGADLEPEASELEELLSPRVRALYLTHALGFPLDALRWREWCDARGLSLIEDAAQAWLARRDGRPVGSTGDLGFFCLYKTVGLPEGAALVSTVPPAPVGLDRRVGVRELARQHGTWLAGRSRLAYAAAAPFRRPRPYVAEEDFALRDPHSAPWRSTRVLLRRLADPAAADRRRTHYRRLLASIGERTPPPFDALPPGASPFAFPIEVDDKATVLGRLRARGVHGLDLWSVAHPSLEPAAFPRALRRRSSILGLPVHQELRDEDVELIADAVRGVDA